MPFRSVLAVLLVAAGFISAFGRALALGMPEHPPYWVVHAIPPAISVAISDQQPRYTSLIAVNSLFYDQLVGVSDGVQRLPPTWDAEHLNAAMKILLDLPQSALDSGNYALLGADDKGIVDFVELSLRLFDWHIEGTVYLYFLLLLISCSLFVIAYFRRPDYLLLPAFVLCGLFLVEPAIRFDSQLGSLLALRCFSILSLVATLHLILAALTCSMRGWRLLTLAPQAGLVIFTLFIRTTTSWQIAAVGMASVAAATYVACTRLQLLSRRQQVFGQVLRSLTPLLLLVVGYGGLPIYRQVSFPAGYHRGDQIDTRAVWHDVFSGLAIDPVLAQLWQLRIDDRSEVLAVRRYLLNAGRTPEWEAINAAHAVYDNDQFNGDLLRWTPYESIVKELLLNDCRAQAVECLKATAYYKPRSLAQDLGWIYGVAPLPADMDVFTGLKPDILATTRKLDAGHTRAYPWSPLALVCVLAGTIVLWKDRRQAMTPLAASLVLAVGSSLPIVVGYPATHTISEMAITVSVLAFFGGALGLAALGNRLIAPRTIVLDAGLLPISRAGASEALQES